MIMNIFITFLVGAILGHLFLIFGLSEIISILLAGGIGGLIGIYIT